MSHRPQDLVFTLFGEYLLHRAGPVWVGTLIALLRPFGLSEGAVRTVLSRMARKSWLRGRRDGRYGFYDLTGRGRALLEEGARRIYHPPTGSGWDGRWLVLAYSIPEDRRHLRDRLRVRLAWLGFGSLGNGLWISPHDVDREVEALARELGIEGRLERFRAEHLGGVDPRDLVARCWDLRAVDARYRDFLDRWKPRLDACHAEAGGLGPDPERAYALRFRLIHEFREFPLEDPHLPRELLPADWKGCEATALVEELHALCAAPADRYLDDLRGREPRPR